MKRIPTFILSFLSFTMLVAQHRQTIDLSVLPWEITLDKEATWQDDELFLPPVEISRLPVRLPAGGWELLEHPDKKGVHLPATVEQHLWGYHGETFGVNGNYTGVSWFRTELSVPREWEGRRVVLNVEAVRFRAEIFVNRQLAGYDLVNSTPFDVEVSRYLKYGEKNEILFRITDPNGNFNWKDSQVYTWGTYRTNPSHGFGGITGRVELTATDHLYIEDLFIKNQPVPHDIEVELTAVNLSGNSLSGKTIRVEITDAVHGETVYVSDQSPGQLPQGSFSHSFRISLPQAKLWSVEEPHLYHLTVTLGEDQLTRRFGFRWFEVRDVAGDRQFYLNGKRIVLRTAISWSFWPDNGIAPTDKLARRQVEIAKELGLNMLNFHRSIGATNVLDYADELGLLYFEEPGGNQYPAHRFDDGDMQADFYFAYRNEKLSRMICRDRNHPSLIIYNLHNERGAYPQAEDYRQMRLAHELDPTRILTYNSSNGENPEGVSDPRFKLHLMPYDTTFYDCGWWDRHHAGGPGTYHDNLYRGVDDYHRFSSNRGEIVFWGEDGAIGTPPRLQLIREEILREGQTSGWEADDYLKWYDAYDRFLREEKFDKAFPTVDDLTRAMGNVSYYYQGRIIENIRISNTVDGYAINGWESMKLENHSGVVDNYRFPKGDVELISRYNRPLYLAVKMDRKVMSVGDTTRIDIYLVNEENLRGCYDLQVVARDEQGRVVKSWNRKVTATGGVVYGELLLEGLEFVPGTTGYTSVEAKLMRGKKEFASGEDDLFAVQLDTRGITANGMVADTTGVLSNFMRTAGFDPKAYTSGTPEGDYLLVGAFEPQQWGSGMSDIMEWVYKGHTLIIVDTPERWAEFLADKEVLDYRGAKVLGRSWYGGNFFNRSHRIFEGLPADVAFNWEYQCFATYNRRRIGLRVFNGETLVGCVSDHKKEVYSALSVIPAGRGKVILTTLDIPACIQGVKPYTTAVDIDGMNESMNTFNTSDRNRANVVGQQLLLNLLKEAYND
ncbi:MAG: beta-glycosidase [Bacteroides sp.]|nr:beta-glycosidase [Bacteroides sp.]